MYQKLDGVRQTPSKATIAGEFRGRWLVRYQTDAGETRETRVLKAACQTMTEKSSRDKQRS